MIRHTVVFTLRHAVGSLKEELAPRHFVIPDQIIDRTKGRVSTFFGGGIVAHVGFAHPFCRILSGVVDDSGRASGATDLVDHGIGLTDPHVGDGHGGATGSEGEGGEQGGGGALRRRHVVRDSDGQWWLDVDAETVSKTHRQTRVWSSLFVVAVREHNL